MPAVAVAVLAAFFVLQCADTAGDDCAREPAGSTKAFFAGGEPSRDVTATVRSITPLPETGGFRYDLGERSNLTWIAPTAIAGVAVGEQYRFVVDYAPGFPDASGILVYRGETLLFAALTDQTLFSHVLKEGIPGFAVRVGDAVCGSRDSTRCHRSMINLPLTIERGGDRATIYHGETVRVGGYEVRALTVQKVEYTPRCADAGLPAISFTIQQ